MRKAVGFDSRVRAAISTSVDWRGDAASANRIRAARSTVSMDAVSSLPFVLRGRRARAAVPLRATAGLPLTISISSRGTCSCALALLPADETARVFEKQGF